MNDIPEFINILKEAIPENWPGKNGVKWKSSWTKSLLRFYEEETGRGTPDQTFTAVAEALGASEKRYKNYALAFRTWFRNEIKWSQKVVPIHQPRFPEREQISPELRERWEKR